MRLPATGLTLPWQLVAAQAPGPMYLMGSLESLFAEAGTVETKKHAPRKSARRERWLRQSNMKCGREVLFAYSVRGRGKSTERAGFWRGIVRKDNGWRNRSSE